VTEVIRAGGSRQTAYQTGLKVDGVVQAVDNGLRERVDIRGPIILGEDPHLADRQVREQYNFIAGWFQGTQINYINRCLK